MQKGAKKCKNRKTEKGTGMEEKIKENGLSGTALKRLACLSMLLDHIGASCIYGGLFPDGLMPPRWYWLYRILRWAGRLRARCGSTLDGIVACPAQAYAGQGGCVRGASPHWEGLTCIRCRTFRACRPHFRHGLSPSLVVAYLTQVRAGKAASCLS